MVLIAARRAESLLHRPVHGAAPARQHRTVGRRIRGAVRRRTVLGSIPDAGFKGDVGSHGPKRYNWAQLVGSFKYTLWRLQERVVGKGVYGEDVPMRPSPTEPGVIERVPGPPPGAAPPATSNPEAPVPPPPGQANPASAPAPGAIPAPGAAPGPEVMGQ